MKIFRHNENQKLYTLKRVPQAWMPGCSWWEATPYKHETELHPHCVHVSDMRSCEPSDFTLVSER